MTQLHSNADSGIDPELLFALIGEMPSPDASAALRSNRTEPPDPAELGRTVGRMVGQSVGGAMGAEIGAVLAPLFASIDDIQAFYSGTGDARETEGTPSREQRSWGDDPVTVPESDSDTSERRTGDTPADGREMTRKDGSGEVPAERDAGSRVDDDEFRKDDGPVADDDERDAWGRRKVGLDWPLPPESRLPRDS